MIASSSNNRFDSPLSPVLLRYDASRSPACATFPERFVSAERQAGLPASWGGPAFRDLFGGLGVISILYQGFRIALQPFRAGHRFARHPLILLHVRRPRQSRQSRELGDRRQVL